MAVRNQPNPDPRVRVNLNLPLSLRDRLVAESAKQQRPMAGILHDALREYLERQTPSP